MFNLQVAGFNFSPCLYPTLCQISNTRTRTYSYTLFIHYHELDNVMPEA